MSVLVSLTYTQETQQHCAAWRERAPTYSMLLGQHSNNLRKHLDHTGCSELFLVSPGQNSNYTHYFLSTITRLSQQSPHTGNDQQCTGCEGLGTRCSTNGADQLTRGNLDDSAGETFRSTAGLDLAHKHIIYTLLLAPHSIRSPAKQANSASRLPQLTARKGRSVSRQWPAFA